MARTCDVAARLACRLRTARTFPLTGLDLKRESYTAFMEAMAGAEGAASLPAETNPVAYHPLISTLHPWSQKLEELNLEAVNRTLVR